MSETARRKTAARKTFSAAARLKSTLEFRRVFDGRRSARNRTALVFYQPSASGRARLGLSVGRKMGDAVRRNRIKRIWREVFRVHRELLPQPYDLVFVPQDAQRCADLAASVEAFRDICAKIHAHAGGGSAGRRS
jgi:ribonuclease P protein component